MDALENKSYWTIDELRAYCAHKNNLASRRWCHRNGVAIRHGMVSKKDIFNCLSRTANVPPSVLYKRITKQKQGDIHESTETDLRNHQDHLGGAKPDAGPVPSLLPSRSRQWEADAGRVGQHDSRHGIQEFQGAAVLVGAH